MLMVDIFEEDKDHQLKAKNHLLSRSTIIKNPKTLSKNNSTKNKLLKDVIVSSRKTKKKATNRKTKNNILKSSQKKIILDQEKVEENKKNEENDIQPNITNNFKTESNILEIKENLLLEKEQNQKRKSDNSIENFDEKPKEELINNKKTNNIQKQQEIKNIKKENESKKESDEESEEEKKYEIVNKMKQIEEKIIPENANINDKKEEKENISDKNEEISEEDEKTESEIKSKKMEKNEKVEEKKKLKSEKIKKIKKVEKKDVEKKKVTKKQKESRKNSVKIIKKYDVEKVQNKYMELYQKKYVAEIICILKTLYIYKQVNDKKSKSIKMITKNYLGYVARKIYREKYIINKIMEERKKYISKIISFMKMFSIRKEIKLLLQRLDDNYIAYSSLTGHKLLYFKIKYENGLEENLYFEYCKPLKSFVLFVNKKEKNLSKKILEGSFYNENYKALVDPLYEQNSRGENIINFLQMFQKEEELEDKYDKIINDWIKKNRVKRQKSMFALGGSNDNDFIDDTDLTKSQNFKVSSFLGNDGIPRSKSFMKLKGVRRSRGILKPVKSFIKLKKEEKKVLFGEPEFKKYDNRK